MIKFGTGGWREVIGEKFTFENVRRFSQGVVNQIVNEGKREDGIIIGYDNRFMAEEFAIAASEVFAGNGIQVTLLTPSVPTPLVNFVTTKKNAAAGLTITASHNPYIYNGIKYIRAGGLPATEEVIKKLEKCINEIDIEDVQVLDYDVAVNNSVIKRVNYMNEFVKFIEEKIDLQLIKGANFQVLYDSMYGTGVNPLLTLLVDGRCHVKLIHDKSDPMFGGRIPAPTEHTLWRLIGMMKEGEYDIGIATDGDGDRIAIVDEEGNYIDANEILVILYYYFMEYKKVRGPVVRNISTTHLLDDIADKYGVECIETPVGFKYIAQAMEEKEAILGGESSGGITFKGHLQEKDAILSAGILLEMIAYTDKTLKEIREEIRLKFGKRYFKEYNYSYKKGSKKIVTEILSKINPSTIYEGKLISTKRLDGYKLEWEDGTWCLVRFSGTEPLLRITVESFNELTTQNIINRMIDSITKSSKR